MYARQDFFELVISKQKAALIEENRKKKDRNDFCSDVSSLLSLIQTWFNYSPSGITTEFLSYPTIFSTVGLDGQLVEDPAKSMRVINGTKVLSIVPESQGLVVVKLGNTDLFSLLWKHPKTTDSKWTISYFNDKGEALNVSFSEDNFFKMLTPFA